MESELINKTTGREHISQAASNDDKCMMIADQHNEKYKNEMA